MDEFLQKLTPEQKYAIEINEDVLITAIPGSGKTRTLINKIIKSFDKNDNRIIIAITFTRRAANEIEDRLHEILGYLPKNIWIGTIHKFCLDFIVRGYGCYSQKFSSNFEILSEPDAEKIKGKLAKKYDLKPYTPIDYTLNINGEPNEEIYKKVGLLIFNFTQSVEQ